MQFEQLPNDTIQITLTQKETKTLEELARLNETDQCDMLLNLLEAIQPPQKNNRDANHS